MVYIQILKKQSQNPLLHLYFLYGVSAENIDKEKKEIISPFTLKQL
jgi:hypothetical protein